MCPRRYSSFDSHLIHVKSHRESKRNQVADYISPAIHMGIRQVDISQAFHPIRKSKRRWAMYYHSPSNSEMPRTSELYTPTAKMNQLPRSRYGFLLLRRLYGGRDAPIRRFAKLSKSLTHGGLYQLKSDICLYSKLNEKGRIIGMLLSHVDDLLYTGTADFLRSVEQIMTQFRTGDIEELTDDVPLISTWLQLEKEKDGIVLLPKAPYIASLPGMSIQEYVSHGQLQKVDGLRSTMRR